MITINLRWVIFEYDGYVVKRNHQYGLYVSVVKKTEHRRPNIEQNSVIFQLITIKLYLVIFAT
jgi:hypothetical protein